MKIPILFQKQKKLQVTARAIPRRDVDESEEPNMRLSSALIVVVLLHLVAVGGIYAFSSLKAHQPLADSTPAIVQPPQAAANQQLSATALNASLPQNTTAARTLPAPPKPALSPAKPAVRDSGQTYTVAKGDNPVAIAKRFGVSYDELLKLNKIDDPKKLQIGQKLHLPPKIKNT